MALVLGSGNCQRIGSAMAITSALSIQQGILRNARESVRLAEAKDRRF